MIKIERVLVDIAKRILRKNSDALFDYVKVDAYGHVVEFNVSPYLYKECLAHFEDDMIGILVFHALQEYEILENYGYQIIEDKI